MSVVSDAPSRSKFLLAGPKFPILFLTALPAASSHGRAWALFDARMALVVGVGLWAGRRLLDVRIGLDSRPLVVPGLLLLAGTLLYTVAADHGELSLVSVLGSLFPVVTVGLGVTLLLNLAITFLIPGIATRSNQELATRLGTI